MRRGCRFLVRQFKNTLCLVACYFSVIHTLEKRSLWFWLFVLVLGGFVCFGLVFRFGLVFFFKFFPTSSAVIPGEVEMTGQDIDTTDYFLQ